MKLIAKQNHWMLMYTLGQNHTLKASAVGMIINIWQQNNIIYSEAFGESLL